MRSVHTDSLDAETADPGAGILLVIAAGVILFTTVAPAIARVVRRHRAKTAPMSGPVGSEAGEAPPAATGDQDATRTNTRPIGDILPEATT